jgi:hypothetical protein
LLVYKGFSGDDSRDFTGQGFLAIAPRGPYLQGFSAIYVLFLNSIFQSDFTPLFKAVHLSGVCVSGYLCRRVQLRSPSQLLAPTNEIPPVLCPNKVVGITHVPAVNSGRTLVKAPVSGHFRRFGGFPSVGVGQTVHPDGITAIWTFRAMALDKQSSRTKIAPATHLGDFRTLDLLGEPLQIEDGK